MLELKATLQFVQTYLGDPLIISKGSLDDHHKQFREVLIKLQEAWLKINANKSDFWTLETEYLGYTLTRKGIKPQTKKVELILALNPPTNVRELRWFLGMVQYYKDMWTKRSKMLSPLTDLVGKCGQTKVTQCWAFMADSYHTYSRERIQYSRERI